MYQGMGNIFGVEAPPLPPIWADGFMLDGEGVDARMKTVDKAGRELRKKWRKAVTGNKQQDRAELSNMGSDQFSSLVTYTCQRHVEANVDVEPIAIAIKSCDGNKKCAVEKSVEEACYNVCNEYTNEEL